VEPVVKNKQTSQAIAEQEANEFLKKVGGVGKRLRDRPAKPSAKPAAPKKKRASVPKKKSSGSNDSQTVENGTKASGSSNSASTEKTN